MTGPASNWSGTYSYTAPRRAAPQSVDDVVRLVRGSTGRIKALGTRHSFTDLPDTDGLLIDMTGVAGEIVLDPDARTLTAPGGTRYGIIAQRLEAEGWAMHNMGSLPHINVAGATATGTHGSGDANGVLSTAVRALQYVGADGEVHEVARGDADYAALVVGAGAFGLITAVTIDIQPTYRVRQDLYAGVSWEAALADLGTLTGAGYSVSIFSRWDADTVGTVWVKSRVEHDQQEPAPALLDGRLTADDSPLGSDDNVTTMREPGPWMLRLPHFRLDREPSFGAEIQTEYFVDRAVAPDALRALRELAPLVRPHLVWTELRTAARDELWLSPAYDRDTLAIHFTWRDRPAEIAALIPRLEAALEPFAARPHWGKVHAFDVERIARVHPRIADARAVFERLDPEGRFVNANLERTGIRSASRR